MGILQDIETAWDFHQKNKEAEEAAKAKAKPVPTVINAPKAVKNAAGYKKYQEATMLEGGTPKSMEEWSAEQQ
jgi:hypothetical protein